MALFFVLNKVAVREKLPKAGFFIAFAIALFLLSYPQIEILAQGNGGEPETESWYVFSLENETDYDGDETPDVITTITPMNDTFIEIYVDQITTTGAYKWAAATCNITGIEDIGKWEYNPRTDVWTYTGSLIDLYGKLTDWGLPSDWCNETDNYGFVLFGAGKGDKQYRLNFTEGHKVIQIYTGQGSELKEAITSKKINELFDAYDSWWNWLYGLDNNTEMHLQDMYVNLTVVGNTVYGRDFINQTKMLEHHENSTIYYIISSFFKFRCFEHPAIDGLNTTICPNDDFNEKFNEFAKFQISQEEKNYSARHGYIFPIENKGNLVYYNASGSPTEMELYKKIRKHPDLNINQDMLEWSEFTIQGITGCLRFKIPQLTYLEMNITMPSISSYTFGDYPEIVTESYTIGNSLYVKIRPYPCCGMEMESQTAEVCA